MSDSFVLGAKQSSLIEDAMRRDGGWDNNLIHLLQQGDHATKIRRYLEGDAKIAMVPDVRDFNKTQCYTLRFFWNYPNYSVDVNDLESAPILPIPVVFDKTAREFGAFLHGLGAANNEVFDFLLKNQKYIPRNDVWRKETIYFPGTAFLSSGSGINLGSPMERAMADIDCYRLKYSEKEGKWVSSTGRFAYRDSSSVLYLCVSF